MTDTVQPIDPTALEEAAKTVEAHLEHPPFQGSAVLDDAIRLLVLDYRRHRPTQWAYDRACEALEKHRRRADMAESDRDEARWLANHYRDAWNNEDPLAEMSLGLLPDWVKDGDSRALDARKADLKAELTLEWATSHERDDGTACRHIPGSEEAAHKQYDNSSGGWTLECRFAGEWAPVAPRGGEVHATPKSVPVAVAQQFTDALNAIHKSGLKLHHRHEDGRYALSEPGHHNGWHDVAVIEDDEETGQWSVAE